VHPAYAIGQGGPFELGYDQRYQREGDKELERETEPTARLLFACLR
jgi:hypothetical protein